MPSLRSLPRYTLVLFALLCIIGIFDGFDAKLATLLLPMVGEEFDAGPAELGQMVSAIGWGAMAAFFMLRLADRWGRKKVLLLSLACYSLLTFACYFAQSLTQLLVLQFFAKIGMVTQIAVAYVMLAEELPGDLRGRGNGLLGACASVGAAVPAAFLAPLEGSEFGWRGLFLMGALPVVLLPVIAFTLREPPVFLERRAEVAEEPSLWGQLRVLLGPGLRKRTAIASCLFFIVSFWSASCFSFFSYYVFQERAWTSSDLQLVVPAAVPFAFAGYAAGGWLMDRVGRRFALMSFLCLGTLVANVCYRSEDWWTIAACWVGMQMAQGMWPIANTISAELFPTEVRAAGTGVSGNLIGRFGFVLGPLLAGTLGERLASTGEAVAWLSFANLLMLPVFYYGLPETRGISLADVAPDEVAD